MATKQTRPVRISNSRDQQTEGLLHYFTYAKNERLARAGKLLGIFWGLAVVTLFIPLAHFLLVPGFLIAGPIMAFVRYRVDESMEKVSGECPTCHEEVDIPLEVGDKLPKWTYCSPHHDSVRIADN